MIAITTKIKLWRSTFQHIFNGNYLSIHYAIAEYIKCNSIYMLIWLKSLNCLWQSNWVSALLLFLCAFTCFHFLFFYKAHIVLCTLYNVRSFIMHILFTLFAFGCLFIENFLSAFLSGWNYFFFFFVCVLMLYSFNECRIIGCGGKKYERTMKKNEMNERKWKGNWNLACARNSVCKNVLVKWCKTKKTNTKYKESEEEREKEMPQQLTLL